MTNLGVNKDSEKYLDKHLVLCVKQMGGLCLKLEAASMAGFPDRTILLSPGRIYFIELKSKGQKPRPLQLWFHDVLRKLGFRVEVIDNFEQLNRFIQKELYRID